MNSTPTACMHIDKRGDGAIKTWRYVRLAMLAVVVGLAASVVSERSKESGWRTSISDYYYTALRGWLIAALIGVAVCMICLRGSTNVEDVLLNLAGLFAPVVAFVPTPDHAHCWPPPNGGPHCGANIAGGVTNNITALLVVGALALVGALILVAQNPTKPAVIALLLATVIAVAALLVFLLARNTFYGYGHYAGAVPMFVCIFLVAISNTRGYKRHRSASSLKNPYALIAGLMVASLVTILIAWGISHTRYVVLLVEADLLILFGAFWIVQTADLWNWGLRPGGKST